MASVPPPIFVVSTGRAGSLMLARAMAEVPGILSFHEPQPHLNTEAYLRWRGELTSEQAETRVRNKRADLVEQVGVNGLTYLESSHYCSHLIPELSRAFGARFVFLHRDPRGFTTSGLARDSWYPDHRPRSELLKDLVRRKLGVDVGNHWQDHRLEPPPGMETRMEKIAWLWTEINGVIIRELEALDSARSHDLMLANVGPEGFGRLLDFLRLDYSPRVIQAMVEVARRKPNSQNRQPSVPEEWDEGAFQSITGPMAHRLGYGTE